MESTTLYSIMEVIQQFYHPKLTSHNTAIVYQMHLSSNYQGHKEMKGEVHVIVIVELQLLCWPINSARN